MKVQELSGSEVLWNSYDNQGKTWFEARLTLWASMWLNPPTKQRQNTLEKFLKLVATTILEFLSHWKKIQSGSLSGLPFKLGSGIFFYFN
ncbi:MAG: hypothetical protein IPG21_18470 [Saprospiraceae bacterium]|nr:hypothetical protein [Candidatus Vicinibacter affinis]